MSKNQATSIYERLGVVLKKSVTVNVGNVELTFHLDKAAYDALLNEMDFRNKVTPTKDYLLAIVDPACRNDLIEVMEIPNVALNLAKVVNDKLIPNIEMTIKN